MYSLVWTSDPSVFALVLVLVVCRVYRVLRAVRLLAQGGCSLPYPFAAHDPLFCALRWDRACTVRCVPHAGSPHVCHMAVRPERINYHHHHCLSGESCMMHTGRSL